MAGSVYGNIFKISTWGESHGEALGVVVDGCPAGLEINEEYIQQFLDRRKPGQSRFSTQRSESDSIKILSGIFEGKTTGTPISMMVLNTEQRSKDYGNIAYCYRPGHADYTFDEKYGIRDYRGGGRSSGRETIGRVAAGAIAVKILNELGITFTSYVKSIGEYEIDYSRFDEAEINRNPLYMPDAECAEKAAAYLKETMMNRDSAGAVVECIVKGTPAGLGEPVFDKLDARLAHAVMSIGAVKAVEIGDGVLASRSNGSQNNDPFILCDGKVVKTTNHAGGILGGISDGSDIILRATFKPTASIFRPQQTVTKDHEETTIEIKGRHDPIIAPRAVVVVEAMTALTVLDELMLNCTSRLDNLKLFYGNK